MTFQPMSAPPQPVIVDTVEKCQKTVKTLLTESLIAVDIEGVSLSRTGEICVIQVATNTGDTYIFDVTKLGKETFVNDNIGLKALLESPEVEKLFYDVRNDSDALYHQFQVEVQNAIDLQILYAFTYQSPADGFLKGLHVALTQYRTEGHITQQDSTKMNEIKEAGLRLFANSHGGQPLLWKERPLRKELIEYAACDVRHMLGMMKQWTGTGGKSKLSAVKQETKKRIQTTIHREVLIVGRDRARRDFEFCGYGAGRQPPERDSERSRSRSKD